MRILERENLQLFLGAMITLVAIAIMNPAKASTGSIQCETAFGEKSFTIQESTVAFHQESENGRSISSVLGARTQRTFNGFRKTLYINGNKHLIHIDNKNHLDQNEDFLAITSPKGHKMTYPLSCKQS